MILCSCVVLTKGIPRRLQTLAMSAPPTAVKICDEMQAVRSPRCVELDKNMLVTVGDNLVEFFAHEGENGLILSLRDRLTLQSRLKSASDIRLDPVLDDGSCDLSLLVNGVLELVLQVLYDKARPDAFGEVERLCVIPELDRIDPNEVDLSPVFESNNPHSFNVFILSLGGRVNEEIGERLPRLGIGHVVLCVDLGNDRNRKFRDPIFDRLNCCRSNGVRIDGNGVVEGTVEDNGWGGDTGRFDYGSISGLSKEIVITMLLGSGLEDCSCSIRGGKVCNGNDLVSFFEFLNIAGGDFRDCGKRLSVEE